jgi:general secretion pathway protein G
MTRRLTQSPRGARQSQQRLAGQARPGRQRSARLAGFTMIEVLVVMSIVVILAGIGLAQYRNGVIRAQEAVLREDLFRMRDALDQYYADKNRYPPDLQSLVGDGYLRAVPKDPFTDSADTWQTVPSEPDPNNPSAAPGIYNVKSGSDRTAIDGTRYAEW